MLLTISMFMYFLLGYIFGSIPFGLILTAKSNLGDIRKIGSGNIGATNVLRTGNKTLAAATLLLDCGKSAVAIYIFVHILRIDPDFTSYYDSNTKIALLFVGLGSIIGHCFPIWLKFKGGKGVATALGVFLAAVPYAGLAACAAWIITAKITKTSSLSALVAVGIAPIVTLFIYGAGPAGICALITLLVWIRHKDNIKRLLKGEEPKIGAGKKDKEEAQVESVSK
ncbi:MAG: acyl-phosphate glycerol 3-phosphate acyltransferase [Alphaproteobacteria bacterium]|nr:MAG: acyl-phosphate glycerol 3-phosphate acyltransferase [Alphaproteobacteria bacterium]